MNAKNPILESRRPTGGLGRVRRGPDAGRAERDPSADLRGAIAPVKHGRMATITEPKKIGELLRAMDGYEGTAVAKCALNLAPLVFVRPGELRHAEWSEIDLKEKAWTIPAERMKAGKVFRVPLSDRCVEILNRANEICDGGPYVFPGQSEKKPLSNMAFLMMIKRMKNIFAVNNI